MVKRIPRTEYDYHADLPPLFLSCRLTAYNLKGDQILEDNERDLKPGAGTSKTSMPLPLGYLIGSVIFSTFGYRTEFHNGDELVLEAKLEEADFDANWEYVHDREMQLCELIVHALAKYERNQEYPKQLHLTMDDILKLKPDEEAATD